MITKEFLYDVWGSGASDVFVTGSDGKVLHYDGASWSTMSTGTHSAYFYDVWGSGPSNVYTVGLEDGISPSSYGCAVTYGYDGVSWKSLGVPPGCSYRSYFRTVWGSSATDVYAAGYDWVDKSGTKAGAIVYHFDGITWKALKLGNYSSSMTAIWGSGPSDVFIFDDYNVYHYDGLSWTLSTSTLGYVGSAWGSNASDIFAVGEGVFRYDGAAWNAMASTTTWSLYGVWGSGPSDVYIVGDKGAIYHYDGTSWTSQSSGITEFDLVGIWGSGPSDLFAVGHCYPLDPGWTVHDCHDTNGVILHRGQ
jgi:hypothetical protein